MKRRILVIQTSIVLLCLLSYSMAFAQLPYSENFTGQNGKGSVGPTPTTDLAGVDWTVDVSAATLSASTDWFQVQNEAMEARDVDGEVIWESQEINVATLSSTIQLSVDFTEDGTLEGTDYARTYYVLDGAETQFSTNGNISDDFTAFTATQSLTLSGNTTLKIRVRLRNNAGTEYIRFDNVSISELAPCVEPTDQATTLVLTPTATSIDGSFTAASSSPDNYIVILSTSATLSSEPVDGTAYNVGDAIGGGTVVTKTSITTFEATSLSQGTQYYLFVYSYNSSCTGEPDYNTTDAELTGNAKTLTVPDIIITEIMLNPSAVSDANGEYFELYNNSGGDVDIDGWSFGEEGGTFHTINNGGPLVITNGGYLVIAKNGDNGTNGGFTANYVASFTLANSEDEIILKNSGGSIVDRVDYHADFPNPTGASMYLTAYNLDNNDENSWAASTTATGITGGDNGSPGAQGEASLPVELIHFSAKRQSETIELHWQTASEQNNSHFVIEHSLDGKYFYAIGEVLGNGTTSQLQNYSYIDPMPALGINYYRLKQVDFDGAFEYSSVISINLDGQFGDVELFPNPTSNLLNINLPRNWNSETILEVYDLTGRLVLSKVTNQLQNTIHVNNWHNGQYIIRVMNTNEVISKYFVKVN